MTDALEHGPCVVSFSGGRDSSAVLAAATQVARQEGLPLPVPATLNFPGIKESQESDWQSLVLDHLGLTERLEYNLTTEMDALGATAQEVLMAHGLVWPYNAHLHLIICKDAAGGTLLTGFGGDELALSARSRWAERAVSNRKFLSPKSAASIVRHLAPSPLQYLYDAPRAAPNRVDYPWLTWRGRLLAAHKLADDNSSIPFGWGRVLREWIPRSRYFIAVRQSLDLMGGDHSVRVLHPFIEPAVLQAFAAHEPLVGMAGRRAIMNLLVGDVLPAEVVNRTSKAEFTDALWNGESLDFARHWDGSGLDEHIVDPAVVKREWLTSAPTVRTTTMLQQAWLHNRGRSGAITSV
ncbi:asparagine synthase-related protein [Actinomycetes bacterium M1A6_2h]